MYIVYCTSIKILHCIVELQLQKYSFPCQQYHRYHFPQWQQHNGLAHPEGWRVFLLTGRVPTKNYLVFLKSPWSYDQHVHYSLASLGRPQSCACWCWSPTTSPSRVTNKQTTFISRVTNKQTTFLSRVTNKQTKNNISFNQVCELLATYRQCCLALNNSVWQEIPCTGEQ